MLVNYNPATNRFKIDLEGGMTLNSVFINGLKDTEIGLNTDGKVQFFDTTEEDWTQFLLLMNKPQMADEFAIFALRVKGEIRG